MENELNAIGKLPEPLAQRTMNLLEKTAEYKMQIDREILELERQEQKNRVSDMRWFSYFYLGIKINQSIYKF